MVFYLAIYFVFFDPAQHTRSHMELVRPGEKSENDQNDQHILNLVVIVNADNSDEEDYLPPFWLNDQ